MSSASIKFRMKIADWRKKQAEAHQAKRMIEGIISVFWSRYFKGEHSDHHKHRATLFTVEGYKDGKEKRKRLAIYARAGSNQNSGTTWPIDDDNSTRNRGVAAQIWANNQIIFKTASCAWPASGNQNLKARYASSLGITVEQAEALNVKSTGFAGAPVIVHGERWGVLLIDTMKTQFAKDLEEQRHFIEVYATIIGAALEGITR